MRNINASPTLLSTSASRGALCSTKEDLRDRAMRKKNSIKYNAEDVKLLE
jgi:hypothetical protein